MHHHHLVDDHPEVVWLFVEHQMPSPDARDVEDGLDQAPHSNRGSGDPVQAHL